MRRVYDQKLRDFYSANPGSYPLKKSIHDAQVIHTVSIRMPDISSFHKWLILVETSRLNKGPFKTGSGLQNWCLIHKAYLRF
jgi:hypothetical protein